MAPYMFTKLIYENKPIKKFGNGTTKRDYTFVSDIVQGIISSLDHEFKYEIFNLGNNHTVKLNYFIEIIEGLVGKKAVIDQHPMQPGDVPITYADLTKSKKLLGYNPTTSIEKGLKIFVDWFLQNRANRDWFKQILFFLNIFFENILFLLNFLHLVFILVEKFSIFLNFFLKFPLKLYKSKWLINYY